jgi:hypothetical protein
MTALLVSIDISFYFDCNCNHYFYSSVDSIVVLRRNEELGSLIEEEDISVRNKLQPGGLELMDSIFGEDFDTEPDKRSLRESATLNAQKAIPYNFQI